MNLKQIRARVRSATGLTMPELYGDEDVDQVVNEVYLDVCGSAEWPFLYVDDTVTVDEAQVTLAYPLRLLSSLSFAGGGRLHQVTIDDLDALEDDREPAKPEVYASVDDVRVALYPEPDRAYQFRLRGWRQAAPLSGDTSSPLFEAEFHPVLTNETAARLLTELGDLDRVEAFRERAADGMSRMRVRYFGSKDRGRIQMGGRANTRRRWRLR